MNVIESEKPPVCLTCWLTHYAAKFLLGLVEFLLTISDHCLGD